MIIMGIVIIVLIWIMLSFVMSGWPLGVITTAVAAILILGGIYKLRKEREA